MHAIGVGGMLCFFILLLFANKVDEVLPLLMAILITGITCTSRLVASNHTTAEVSVGMIAGVLIQFVAWLIVY